MEIETNYIVVFGTLAVVVLCIVKLFARNNNKEVLDYNEMELIFLNKISEKNRPYKLGKYSLLART
jgi:hypothetical protein